MYAWYKINMFKPNGNLWWYGTYNIIHNGRPVVFFL